MAPLALAGTHRWPAPTRLVGFWVDFAVKAGLVAMLLFAVASPDLPQFQGKAMAGRALTYPVAILIVPAAWLFLRRRRTLPFPYAIDILIALPFLFDTAGNALTSTTGSGGGMT